MGTSNIAFACYFTEINLSCWIVCKFIHNWCIDCNTTNFCISFVWCPVEMSCVETMVTFHTATDSTLMTSVLFISGPSFRTIQVAGME